MSAKDYRSTDADAREITAALSEAIRGERLKRNWPLAPYTTFKVGGAADFFVEVRNEKELLAVLRAAKQWKLPVTMLGGGSNVLIGDRGIRGLVVRSRHGEISRPSAATVRALRFL